MGAARVLDSHSLFLPSFEYEAIAVELMLFSALKVFYTIVRILDQLPR
jgi:hypothetical protein